MTDQQYINKITTIIYRKHWMDSDFSRECLKRLSDMNSFLDNNDRQMIVDLLQEFDKFFSDSYTKMLKDVLGSIPKASFCQKNVFLCAMAKFDDLGKIKSGPALAYLSHELKYHSFFEGKTLEIEPLSYELLRKLDSNSLLIIVDDFLGSGDTFFEMINNFPQLGSKKESIIVISLVSMEEGFNKVKKAGFNIYTGKSRKKGISELMPENKRDKYLDLMKNIEKKINTRAEFSLGYKQSEALISMIRTPNNTFPVFWKKNKYFNPPFER